MPVSRALPTPLALAHHACPSRSSRPVPKLGRQVSSTGMFSVLCTPADIGLHTAPQAPSCCEPPLRSPRRNPRPTRTVTTRTALRPPHRSPVLPRLVASCQARRPLLLRWSWREGRRRRTPRRRWASSAPPSVPACLLALLFAMRESPGDGYPAGLPTLLSVNNWPELWPVAQNWLSLAASEVW